MNALHCFLIIPLRSLCSLWFRIFGCGFAALCSLWLSKLEKRMKYPGDQEQGQDFIDLVGCAEDVSGYPTDLSLE